MAPFTRPPKACPCGGMGPPVEPEGDGGAETGAYPAHASIGPVIHPDLLADGAGDAGLLG